MIQISPLNQFSIIATARARDKDDRSDGVGRIEEVVMYRCPACRDLHEFEDEAADCCKPKAPPQSWATCPVCGEHHRTHRDAADCCLWKDLDAYARMAIADAVEAGSDWITELGLIEKVGAVKMDA